MSHEFLLPQIDSQTEKMIRTLSFFRMTRLFNYGQIIYAAVHLSQNLFSHLVFDRAYSFYKGKRAISQGKRLEIEFATGILKKKMQPADRRATRSNTITDH